MTNFHFKKFPLIEYDEDRTPWFSWQSSFADAIDHHYMLRCTIWERLSNYDYKDNTALTKTYKSADVAVKDFLQAIEGTKDDH